MNGPVGPGPRGQMNPNESPRIGPVDPNGPNSAQMHPLAASLRSQRCSERGATTARRSSRRCLSLLRRWQWRPTLIARFLAFFILKCRHGLIYRGLSSITSRFVEKQIEIIMAISGNLNGFSWLLRGVTCCELSLIRNSWNTCSS